jgi:hypothetical protein
VKYDEKHENTLPEKISKSYFQLFFILNLSQRHFSLGLHSKMTKKSDQKPFLHQNDLGMLKLSKHKALKIFFICFYLQCTGCAVR